MSYDDREHAESQSQFALLRGGPVRIAKAIIAASECACEEVHEFTTTGTVTGGTWAMDYTINAVTETIASIDDATTAAQLQTKIEGHSEVAPGDIVCFGGNFPDVAIYCKFIGDLAITNIALPTPNSGSLTGTAPRVKVRKASAYDWS